MDDNILVKHGRLSFHSLYFIHTSSMMKHRGMLKFNYHISLNIKNNLHYIYDDKMIVKKNAENIPWIKWKVMAMYYVV
jgi:hypothetical protein